MFPVQLSEQVGRDVIVIVIIKHLLFSLLLICSYELVLIKAFRFSGLLSEEGGKTYLSPPSAEA